MVGSHSPSRWTLGAEYHLHCLHRGAADSRVRVPHVDHRLDVDNDGPLVGLRTSGTAVRKDW